MNYKDIYFRLINSRKLLNRSKNDAYYENHHIIPKCFGGRNDQDNKVLLTAKEHFIAHLLLTKMYTGKEKGKMCYALFRMCKMSKHHQRIITARQFELAKELMMKNCVGENSAFWGRKHRKDSKAKMSKTAKEKWKDEIIRKERTDSLKKYWKKNDNRKNEIGKMFGAYNSKRIWSIKERNKRSKKYSGKNNPRAQRIIVDGKNYDTIQDCADKLKMSRSKVCRRLYSNKWENWIIL